MTDLKFTLLADKKYLILVVGPTAVGKTNLCLNLAKKFNTEIVSCDSRQFYREMNLGTAKPSPEELQQVGRQYFARSPRSDIWVEFGDLPLVTRDALWEKHKATFAFAAMPLWWLTKAQ